MIFDRQTTKRFSDSIPPGESVTHTYTVEADATIESLAIRFYQGPELDLSVYPFRRRETDELPLIDLVGRDEIVGDADDFHFQVSEPVQDGDIIGVTFTNNSDTYSYDCHADVTLDQLGGAERVMTQIKEVF